MEITKPGTVERTSIRENLAVHLVEIHNKSAQLAGSTDTSKASRQLRDVDGVEEAAMDEESVAFQNDLMAAAQEAEGALTPEPTTRATIKQEQQDEEETQEGGEGKGGTATQSQTTKQQQLLTQFMTNTQNRKGDFR